LCCSHLATTQSSIVDLCELLLLKALVFSFSSLFCNSIEHKSNARLGFQFRKGGISRLTPSRLAPQLQSLPPILHMQNRKPMPSYSKGSRGLSVPLRVGRIFTATTISPRSSLRQFHSRYTIRAGRNLPDKEFRYLRTVIVTAAVYWGFDSMLRIASNISC
jgi:hypothetical protein